MPVTLIYASLKWSRDVDVFIPFLKNAKKKNQTHNAQGV